jgi:para-aminobenzoate synthetase component I
MPAFALPLKAVLTTDLPWCAPLRLVANWLESDTALGLISDGGALGHYSYLATAPDAEITMRFNDTQDPRDLLQNALECTQVPHDPALPPFSGGVIGLASFELGLRLESMWRGPFCIEGGEAWPELMLRRYPAVLAFDHQSHSLTAIGRGETPLKAKEALDAIITAYEQTLKASEIPPTGPLSGPLLKETLDEVYEDKIKALIQQIHSGDLFQANLARGFQGRLHEGVTPGQVMAAIMRRGAAPFGGFLRFGDRCILSNSPERFIALSPDGQIETRPIKGTRPRGTTPEQDGQLAAELLASEKDRAENLMIVDLMRHDLSKVSRSGSVKVEALNALESYANVHHLVSSITARLRPDKTAADVIAETFPPGSISGAPKVQAMKVISEMEAPRGPYCGSLFYIGAGGGMDSNVLIRTIALEADANGQWHFRLCGGGGIVADSNPSEERQESDDKLSLLTSVLLGTTT